MATCNLGDLIDQACDSGFKCLDEQAFRGLVLQLLCNINAEGISGGLTPLTITSYSSPSFPFQLVSTRRCIVEVLYTFVSAGGTAAITVSRTGAPDTTISLLNAGLTTQDLATFRLGPGDTITIVDSSALGGLAVLDQITVYTE